MSADTANYGDSFLRAVCQMPLLQNELLVGSSLSSILTCQSPSSCQILLYKNSILGTYPKDGDSNMN
jgi:hypothetical protein